MTVLWRLTGLVALLLLVVTISLFIQDRATRQAGFEGYITGSSGAIYLRQDPNSASTVVTILELGVPVFVTERRNENDVDWLHIQTETAEGWIPANRVTTEVPAGKGP